MTEEQRLFHQAFQFTGGLFHVNDKDFSIVNDIRKSYEGLLHYLTHSHSKFPKIHFDIINNLSLNACATKSGDYAFVGINIGAYLIMEDMFDKMMASHNVLPNIGDVSKETQERKLLNVIETDKGLHFALPDPLFPGKVSHDPTRRQLAKFYKFIAFQFIALHEFAHIAQGHVGYLQSLHMPVYSELNPGSKDTMLEFSVNQAMERDADMAATIRAYQIASHFMKLDKSTLESFPFYNDWETFIFHWTFAVYSLFRLFGFKKYDDMEARLSTHPPPSVRMAIISLVVVGLFSGTTITRTDKNVSVTMFEAAIEAEKALQSISFFPNATDIYMDDWYSEKMKEYMFEIWTNAYDLQPVFKPFSCYSDS